MAILRFSFAYYTVSHASHYSFQICLHGRLVFIPWTILTLHCVHENTVTLDNVR